MERFRSQERERNINFLNENLKVSFEISPEAFQYLPVISKEDIRIGLERFAVLLGIVRINQDGSVHLEIKGVYQETEEDVHRSYKEGVDSVTYDLKIIQDRAKEIQQDYKEYQNFKFLGDIHTHPSSGIAEPSRTDLLSVIRAYESGDIKVDQPYIFGIGARHVSGEMEYWFYRIIKTDSESGWGYKALDE